MPLLFAKGDDMEISLRKKDAHTGSYRQFDEEMRVMGHLKN